MNICAIWKGLMKHNLPNTSKSSLTMLNFSSISTGYNIANNKHLTFCDLNRPTKYITQLEKSYLYSFAMSKSRPMFRFKQLDPVKINLNKYNNNCSRG